MKKELVSGITHVAMKCVSEEEYEKAKHFYGEVIGLKKVREWPDGVLFGAENGNVEIFRTGGVGPVLGALCHFAFLTDDADECVRTVRKAGYEIIREPSDVELKSDPVCPIRVAFCHGPLGEEIEFFQERGV